MAKLSLDANPTFPAKVGIPVAGGASVDVEFTFKHRLRDDLEKWLESTATRDDLDSVMDMVVAWELSDEFNRENVSRFIQNYLGAPRQIVEKYIAELTGQKAKN